MTPEETTAGHETPPPGGEGATTAPWRLPKLRVDVDGAWHDDDVEVTHHGVLANLRANLRRDDEGYFIQTRVRIPVAVDDVPWVVTRVERRGERLYGILNDGTETVIDPATLRIGRADVPYCTVKDGAFEARLSRAATFQLLALGEYDERTDRGALRLAGRTYELSSRTPPTARHARPAPASPPRRP